MSARWNGWHDKTKARESMPNRIIKESVCTSDTIERLTPEQESLFYRLIVNCDDYGRMDGRAAVVRAKCFPLRLDRISDGDVDAWLSVLAEELILLYEVEGRRFLQVRTWEKHQQIRAKRSKYPSPNGHLPAIDSIGNPLTADSLVIQSESNPNPNPNPYMVKCFDTFWSAYPKKKAKAAAEKAFKKIKLDDALMATMLVALEKAKSSEDWLKQNGQFIPHPGAWLNGRRWEDEITEGGNHSDARKETAYATRRDSQRPSSQPSTDDLRRSWK